MLVATAAMAMSLGLFHLSMIVASDGWGSRDETFWLFLVTATAWGFSCGILNKHPIRTALIALLVAIISAVVCSEWMMGWRYLPPWAPVPRF